MCFTSFTVISGDRVKCYVIFLFSPIPVRLIEALALADSKLQIFVKEEYDTNGF